MSDAELRSLERQVQAGNPYAQRILALRKHRHGLIPKENLFLQIDGSEAWMHLGVHVEYKPEYGRWMPDIEENFFFEYFLVNGDKGRIVVADIVPNALLAPDPIESQYYEQIPPILRQQPLEWLDVRSQEGWVIIHNIVPLFEVDLHQLYHPFVYDERHIPEYEDMPDYPSKEIVIAYKAPHQDLQLFNVITESDFLSKLVGPDWVSHPIGNDLRIVASDIPHGEPNFIIEQPAMFSEQHRQHPALIAIEDGIPEELFQPRIQPVYGPVAFVKFVVPDIETINWNVLPWPWNKLGKENSDMEWPTTLEGVSLDEADIKQIENFMKPLSVKLPIPATHFAQEPRGGYIIFELETCEDCGKIALAPNSLNVFASAAELRGAGLQQLDSLPPELGWSEEFGGAVCDDCY